MSLREVFLRDILEHPDDDGLRLIFADWLDDQGDPRGEFIRLQIRLTEGLPALQAEELRRREREMLNEHGLSWLGRDFHSVRRWAFRRGFLAEIQLPADRFLRTGEGLLQREPVTCLRLAFATRVIEALAASPLLTHLTELDLAYNHLNDAAVVALASSPYLGRLRVLRLGHNYLRRLGAEALAAALSLSGLTRLDMTGNLLTSQAHRALRDQFGDRVTF